MLMRTRGAGTLRPEQIGETVVLNGWVRRRRDHGGLIFLDLWDRSGLAQVVFDPGESPDAYAVADQCRGEYVLAVRGEVMRRPPGTENPRLPTGEVELRAREAEILNPSLTPPFPMEEYARVDESVRLRYRYIDLRRPPMQRMLELRHRVVKACRDFLHSEGFWEIETPIMIRSTPEGARDYVVPDRRYPGKFWALPQSPQLFKQILQVSGVERYFQIARCFRDEDLRADRQPEFTQIDMEMSFVTQEEVFDVTERLFQAMFRAGIGVELTVPFPRMAYHEAIERYGTDKPDTRFGIELVELGDIFAHSEFRVFQQALASGGRIKGIVAPGCAGYSRKQIDDLTQFARRWGAGGLITIALEEEGFRSSIQRYLTAEQIAQVRERAGAGAGDLILIVADRPAIVAETLNRLRLEIGDRLGLRDPDQWNFLWIVDFPLFERNEETGAIEAMHHPFSAPRWDELYLLDEDPLRVTGQLYDLVVNGWELGSGSIRIHRRDVQEKVFQVIGIGPEEAQQRFGFLLEAFQYGAPPHGGIAPGLDRILALMLGTESIRDAIAFPKTAAGTDLMLDAPSELTPEQLRELHLRVVLPEEGASR